MIFNALQFQQKVDMHVDGSWQNRIGYIHNRQVFLAERKGTMAQVTRPGGARRIPPRFPCRKKDQSTPTRKRTVLQSLIPNHDESGLNESGLELCCSGRRPPDSWGCWPQIPPAPNCRTQRLLDGRNVNHLSRLERTKTLGKSLHNRGRCCCCCAILGGGQVFFDSSSEMCNVNRYNSWLEIVPHGNKESSFLLLLVDNNNNNNRRGHAWPAHRRSSSLLHSAQKAGVASGSFLPVGL